MLESSDHRVRHTLTGQLFRFGIVGAVGFLIDTGLTLVLAGLGFAPWAARPPAIVVAAALTWGMNRAFTFRVNAPVRSLVPYAFVAGVAALVNYALFVVAVEVGLSIILSIAVATSVSMVASFVGYRRLAFGLRLDGERVQSG